MDGKYILTYIDDYSSYPEVQVLKEITSSEVIGVLTEIFLRFGFPEETVSDNGKQFISAKFEAFLKSCGIRHVHASPYYVPSNGKVERFHRYLKKNFLAVIAEGKSWQRELLMVMMAISGNSPAKLLINHKIQMKVPHIELSPDPQLEQAHCAKCESYQARLKDYHDTRCHTDLHDFKVGNVVFCANMRPSKLDSKFQSAKHVIVKAQGRDIFGVVNVDTSATLIRNTKYLKHVPISSSEIVEELENRNKALGSSDKGMTNPDAFKSNEPAGYCDEQAFQNNESNVVTTRSGRVVGIMKILFTTN